MKKVLYGTTALIAAGMFASAAEAATPIKMTIGGYLNSYMGWTSAELKNAGDATLNNRFDVMTDAQIAFTGATTLDNGIKVGAVVEVKATTFGEDNNWIDDVYATVDSKYGRAIIGATDNVAVMQHVSAPDAGVLGVEETKFIYWGVNPGVVLDATYADLDGNAQKISYISPKMAGFSFGLSWVPGAEAKAPFADGNGYKNQSVVRNGADFRSAYVLSGAYNGKFKNVELDASVAYANYDAIGGSNVEDYNAGVSVGVAGFTVGGAYRNVDMAETGQKDSKAYDFGVGYENGPYAVSASYFVSQNGKKDGVKGNKLEMYQVSGKYKLGAGVDAFATFAYLDSNLKKDNAAIVVGTTDKDAWTVVTGLALTF
ncbi:MAG: porin [Alphaproteobacteria bacterium]|nr:porin [Alphaproteobacteria bacterium]